MERIRRETKDEVVGENEENHGKQRGKTKERIRKDVGLQYIRKDVVL